jgi:hypothetical protein
MTAATTNPIFFIIHTPCGMFSYNERRNHKAKIRPPHRDGNGHLFSRKHRFFVAFCHHPNVTTQHNKQLVVAK